MRSFEERLGEFEARGVRVAAISVDPPEASKELRRGRGYTFTFLADTDGAVTRRFGVEHEGAGPRRADIARPAEFLVDPSGTIRWVNLSESIVARARPEHALRAMDQAGMGIARAR